MTTLLSSTWQPLARDVLAIIDRDVTVHMPAPGAMPVDPPRPKLPASSHVHGVSLANVLQMLQLERLTCLLEVTSGDRFGTLILVNGELLDADADGVDGEEAVCRVLAWPAPHTTILDGVTLFQNTVKASLSALIVEAARRQDEAVEFLPAPPACDRILPGQPTWQGLVETLAGGGARAAAVIHARDERVLARTREESPSAVWSSFDRELTPVLRAATHWARQSFPSIDEVTLRLGDRHALIAPLDPEHEHFVCAIFSRREAMDAARATIRAFTER